MAFSISQIVPDFYEV